MTEQGKTLGQLNVQPGDVVRCVDDGSRPWWTVGKEYPVYEGKDGPIIRCDDDDPWLDPSALFTVVFRAGQPADPAPVTWPEGVAFIGLKLGATLTMTSGILEVKFSASHVYLDTTEARQLAALLIAAANHVEGK